MITTVANVQQYMGITGDDALITRLISVAQKTIENYTKRTWGVTNLTEVYKGTGTNYLNLKSYPITAVASLKHNNNLVGDPSWETIDSDFYYVNQTTGQLYYSGGFYKQENMYQIVYTAGEATPADIEQACINLVAHMFNSRANETMKSETLGEYSYTKETKSGNIISDLGLNLILDSYREPTI